MASQRNSRAQAEVEHGKRLSVADPEAIWGWGTAAGQLRARRRANLVLAGAQIGPGDRVLELGCGTGMFTEMFATSGADIVAVDVSDELLARARARGIPNVRFLCRRFEDCEFDKPFDAIIGSSVLHHLDVDDALTMILRFLKPGGLFSFAEPNYLNPQVFAERRLRFIRPLFWHVSPDETAFVRWRFQVQLTTSGFDEVVITPYDWVHPATPARLIPFVRAVGGALERTPIIREFSGSLYINARRRR